MNTEDLIKEAKARFHHNYQKIQLAQKYKSKLLFADQGGLWSASPELLALLSALDESENIVIDSYGNPIKVNSKILKSKAVEIYTTVMAEWHAEFETMKNNR